MSTTQGKLTYFLSDLHLGANYLEHPRDNERRVVRFLDSIAPTASAVYLLGDVLDYWFEYRTVVPRGYVRFFAALASLADAGVAVYWLTGNHDVWLFDYLRDELGITVLHEHGVHNIMGKHFFLSHGDDVGYQPPLYRFMRYCFYNKWCQHLYATIHPRWTHAVAHGWSSQNRTGRNHEQVATAVEKSVKHLLDFATRYCAQNDQVDFFVFGHLHIARCVEVPGTACTITFLGDWISQFTYAVFDGEQLQLKSFKEN